MQADIAINRLLRCVKLAIVILGESDIQTAGRAFHGHFLLNMFFRNVKPSLRNSVNRNQLALNPKDNK